MVTAMPAVRTKVLVALSGGVDSSVCAYLLKEQGYDVTAVVMKMSPLHDDTVEAAKQAAAELKIPLTVLDLQEQFRANVIDYFVRSYRLGITPNPCVVCNPTVKFKALIDEADRQGCAFAATGHYAQIGRLLNGRYALKKSATQAKDQTYALYNLTQEQLARTLMPVGAYTKEQIRELAKKISLKVASKPDSQEICFIPDNDYAKFIDENTDKELPAGNFVDMDGNVLGRHKGITHYTVGQRKGLGLSMGHPVFVTEIRPETNEVVIGGAGEVFSDTLRCSRLNWMAIDGLHGEKLRVTAKIRYSHKGAPCTIEETENGIVQCRFDEPQRAITPGQAVVFYDGDFVVGGGNIL